MIRNDNASDDNNCENITLLSAKPITIMTIKWNISEFRGKSSQIIVNLWAKEAADRDAARAPHPQPGDTSSTTRAPCHKNGFLCQNYFLEKSSSPSLTVAAIATVTAVAAAVAATTVSWVSYRCHYGNPLQEAGIFPPTWRVLVRSDASECWSRGNLQQSEISTPRYSWFIFFFLRSHINCRLKTANAPTLAKKVHSRNIYFFGIFLLKDT